VILAQCPDDEIDPPTDQMGCPIVSKPGMQVIRISDDRYDVLYTYKGEQMYIRDIDYSDISEMIYHHEMEQQVWFDPLQFDFAAYCDRGEEISRGASYHMDTEDIDAILQERIDLSMTEVDYFRNFVLLIGSGECVKM
jgi:hypothetical protein